MASIRTTYGDEVEVERVEGGTVLVSLYDGRWVQVFLTCDEAREMAKMLRSAAETGS